MKKCLVRITALLILCACLWGCTPSQNHSPTVPTQGNPVLDVTPLIPATTAAPTSPETTAAPTQTPTQAPTQAPTPEPTQAPTAAPTQTATPAPTKNPVSTGIGYEAGALPAPLPLPPTAVASGTLVKVSDGGEACIDYSNTKDGYVMAQYTAATDKRLKAQVKGPNTTYTFNLSSGTWAAFPLADGNGTYQISILRNTEGSKYAKVLVHSVDVTLTDEFAPFLHSNQFVNYDCAPITAAMALQLCQGKSDLDKVTAVYDYVVKGLRYDTQLAATVQSGYLPDLDQVLQKKKGICFDYAALMTGMLRSQGVPCKLVVGYAGEVYHAWISVWTENTGWVEGVIFFDGTSWQRMDPTFASGGTSQDYIGNGSNYSAKYIY